MQRSESFALSALLSFSGGLQDAYTYNIRGSVFANAQTGNVVLMSQNFMCGNWTQALYYLCPLLAFSFGVFAAEQTESRYKHSRILHWRQIILLLEIAALGIVGILPLHLNMAANMLGILLLRYAGPDLPDSTRLWLCQHHVHRKFKKRNGKSFPIPSFRRSCLFAEGTSFFRDHPDFCPGGRLRRRSVRQAGNQNHLDQCGHFAGSCFAYGKRGMILRCSASALLSTSPSVMTHKKRRINPALFSVQTCSHLL